MNKHVIVIAGPTGSGESTITNQIIARYANVVRLVTATTRHPRLNEQDGIDYYFFTPTQFKEELTKGNILEHTFVPGRDVYYGTYKVDLEKKLQDGKTIIVNPDVVGAKYYKEKYQATTIFVKTESLAILRERLKNREPDMTDEELKKRLDAAAYELDHEEQFYDYVVINRSGELEATILQVVAILQKEGYTLREDILTS